MSNYPSKSFKNCLRIICIKWAEILQLLDVQGARQIPTRSWLQTWFTSIELHHGQKLCFLKAQRDWHSRSVKHDIVIKDPECSRAFWITGIYGPVLSWKRISNCEHIQHASCNFGILWTNKKIISTKNGPLCPNSHMYSNQGLSLSISALQTCLDETDNMDCILLRQRLTSRMASIVWFLCQWFPIGGPCTSKHFLLDIQLIFGLRLDSQSTTKSNHSEVLCVLRWSKP